MGSLKRKEGPGGSVAAKTPKSTSDPRPSKRSKSDGTPKSEGRTPTKTAPAPAPTPVISKLKDEEELFPRGGGSILSPLEHKKIQVQAKNDVLFEQDSSSKKREKKEGRDSRRSRKSAGDEDLKTRDEDGVHIESLNYKVCPPLAPPR